jgi:hypothetical protein
MSVVRRTADITRSAVYGSPSAVKLSNQFGDVNSPSIQCVLALGKEIMSLVDRCDARDCS